MNASFFDSNVLLYVASSDDVKAHRAETLLRSGGLVSVQIMNEVANVARRKMGLSWPETHALLAAVRGLVEVRDLSVETHERGLAVAERFQLPIYDAMVISAALEAGCATLWTEDMQHGLTIDGSLRIENPFLGS